jgi:hypothetical protein
MFGNVHKRILRPRWRPALYAGRPTFGAPKIDGRTPRGTEVSTHDISEPALAHSHEQLLSPSQAATAAVNYSPSESNPRVDALDLALLRNSDFVMVRTSHSVYEFVVTNAADRIGWLSGGNYTEPRRAKLLGVTGDAGTSNFPLIRSGARAVFLLEAVGGAPRKLVTSPVTCLSHYRFSTRFAA